MRVDHETMHKALALPATTGDIVRAYKTVCAEIRQGFAALARAEEAMEMVFNGSGHARVHIVGCHQGHNWSEVDEACYQVRVATWGALIDRLGLRNIVSIAAWNQLEKDLKDQQNRWNGSRYEWPEITEEAIENFVTSTAKGMDAAWEEAVREVFDWLRPRKWDHDYRSNHVERIGPRVVVPHMVSLAFYGVLHIRYDQDVRLAALERVLSGLAGEGKTQTLHKSRVATAMEVDKVRAGETPWFTWRAFKNGNLHLAFTRLDLIEKMNAIAGGKRLAKGEAA